MTRPLIAFALVFGLLLVFGWMFLNSRHHAHKRVDSRRRAREHESYRSRMADKARRQRDDEAEGAGLD